MEKFRRRNLGGHALRRYGAALACLVLLSTATKAQNQNLFFSPPTYPGGGLILTADFNQDGKADLVSGDGTVMLGNGDGTFRTTTPWTATAPSGARLLAAADFNGDGKPDLLVSSSSSLCVLPGNGDGTFQTPVCTAVGIDLGTVVVRDVNGDGKADVLGLSGALFVFLGKGDGTFAPAVTYSVANSAAILATGDFNGDGKLDVVVANAAPNNTASGTASVFLGNGDGTFRAPITSIGANFPQAIVAGDVNGDGKVDLIIGNQGLIEGGTDQTFIMLGNGDGTFQTPGSPLPAMGTLALVDLNGDGKLDVVIGNSPFVEMFLGNGDGTFTLKDSYLAQIPEGNNDPLWMVTADFNGDNKPDVAIANEILIGNGDGSFHGISGKPVPQFSLQAAVAGDFNNDGSPDVAAVSDNDANDLYIFVNDGTGNFSLAHTYTFPAPAYFIAAADLNGDGKLDLVVITIDPIMVSWSLNVMFGNGDGSFSPPIIYPQAQIIEGPPSAMPMAVADFNGDHKPDVALLASSGDVYIFLNNGDGTLAPPISYFAGSNPDSLGVGDFNNDGKLDIATAGAAGLGILLGNGDGTFQPAAFSNSGVMKILAVADLNSNGSLDLVTIPNGGGGFQVLLGNGDGTFSALPQTTQSVNQSVSVADINGDGKLDLVTGLGVQVLLGNGDGTFGSPTVIIHSSCLLFCNPVVGERFILSGDFYRDGRPDLVVDAAGATVGVTWVTGGFATLKNTASPPAPDFLVTAQTLLPSTVAPGSSATSTVTLTPVGGFSGGVTLSCTGLPSGAACTFTPPSLNGSGTSALTISTMSSTPVGTYPVGVTGASSTLTHSVPVTLIVATSAGATTVALAPTTLTFAQSAIGGTSSPQTVQFTNTGAAPLVISGISVGGANASDFSLESNSCGSGIAAGSGCQINVTFAPTGMGARTANLSVNDNATGSPHMVSLNGMGPDFSLAPSGQATATIMAGQTASYTLAVIPSGGFYQTVALSCSGAPAQSTCSVSPNSLVLSGSTAGSVAVKLATMGASFATPRPSAPNCYPPLYLSTELLVFSLLIALLYWRTGRRPRLAYGLALVMVFSVAELMSGCGGGSSSGGGGGNHGTPAGTYTIVVSGTFTSGSTSLTHSVNLSLVVQ